MDKNRTIAIAWAPLRRATSCLPVTLCPHKSHKNRLTLTHDTKQRIWCMYIILYNVCMLYDAVCMCMLVQNQLVNLALDSIALNCFSWRFRAASLGKVCFATRNQNWSSTQLSKHCKPPLIVGRLPLSAWTQRIYKQLSLGIKKTDFQIEPVYQVYHFSGASSSLLLFCFSHAADTPYTNRLKTLPS